MNPIKALGCRLVQAGFRLAMPVMPYRRPKTLGSVEEVPAALAEQRVKNVLLITDRHLRGCGVTRRLEEALKAEGIRCAVCSEPVSARLAREHNNANIVAMGARTIGPVVAEAIADVFLTTDFEGGRHAIRVNMISALENGEELS